MTLSASGCSSAPVCGSNGLALAAMSTRNGWPVRTTTASGLPAMGWLRSIGAVGLRLHHLPGRLAAEQHIIGGAEDAIGTEIAIVDELAGVERRHMLGRQAGVNHVHRVGAQEHLMRGMRGVGLVLVDERRGLVGVVVDVVGGAQDAVW